MAIDLPNAIAGYFAAETTKNAESVALCFTEAALVKDDGETYKGRDAIQAWVKSYTAKFSCTVQPLSMATERDRVVVTSRVEGNFPGSPVDLRYRFALEGEEIAMLEIGL